MKFGFAPERTVGSVVAVVVVHWSVKKSEQSVASRAGMVWRLDPCNLHRS